ncbi:MAG: FliH/SctL family protein [Desulforhopalus sp.]
MNLSKYYSSSDEFQPESLVQNGNGHGQHHRTFSPASTSPDHPANLFSGSPSPLSRHHRKEENIQESAVVEATSEATDPPRGIATEDLHPAPHEVEGGVAGNHVDPAEFMEKIIAEEQIDDAYQRGLKDGLEKAEEDFGDALRAFLLAGRQLDTIRETLIRNSRDECIEFALAIAEKIVRTSVRDQDKTIIATIEEALQRAIKSDEFTIHLNPADYQTVVKKCQDLIAGVSGLSNVVVRQDSTIEPGGAMIESDNCTIDCTVTGQFEAIREELTKKR